MDAKKYVLIGKALDQAALKAFPETATFSLQENPESRGSSPSDLVQDQVLHHLDRLSVLMMHSITLQCPVGPHQDPGLEYAVLRACNISKVGSVAVQCSQGHWAEYPCG